MKQQQKELNRAAIGLFFMTLIVGALVIAFAYGMAYWNYTNSPRGEYSSISMR